MGYTIRRSTDKDNRKDFTMRIEGEPIKGEYVRFVYDCPTEAEVIKREINYANRVCAREGASISEVAMAFNTLIHCGVKITVEHTNPL